MDKIKLISDELARKIFELAKAIILRQHFVYKKKEDGWYHGSDYVNKDAIYPYVMALHLLCYKIADHFRDFRIEVVVGPTIGGVGISQIVAYYLNIFKDTDPFDFENQILAIYAEEEPVYEDVVLDLITSAPLRPEPGKLPIFTFSAEGKVIIECANNGIPLFAKYQQKVGTKRVFKRGYDKFLKGKRTLAVEDVVNRGTTINETIKAAREIGADIIGVAALADRSGGKVTGELLGCEYYSLLQVIMKMEKEEVCSICAQLGPESVRTDIGKGEEFLRRIGKK